MVKDANGKLLTLAFALPVAYQQRLSNAMDCIHSTLPGELEERQPPKEGEDDQPFVSLHYSWYARYAERVLFLSRSRLRVLIETLGRRRSRR